MEPVFEPVFEPVQMGESAGYRLLTLFLNRFSRGYFDLPVIDPVRKHVQKPVMIDFVVLPGNLTCSGTGSFIGSYKLTGF